MLRFYKSLLLPLSLFIPLTSVASITLEPGSYANRSNIDAHLHRANLNFTYRGCDKDPKPNKIKLKVGNSCRSAKSLNLQKIGDQTSLSGTVGEIVATYDDPSGPCPESRRVTKRLHTNRSLTDLYEDFQKQNCFPSHLLLRDGTPSQHRRIVKNLRERSLCNIPSTRIRKKNFPTEESPFFHLRANDKGFSIGNESHYRFDHDRNQWCVKYKTNNEKCGQWPSPLPIAYQDEGDRLVHLKATVSLGPNGQASIRAIDKSFRSQAALFQAQKNGELLKTNINKGRIDFNTWRNNGNGLVRSIVRTYSTDGPNPIHERSINFFPRNVFGLASANSWCSQEHCFAQPPESTQLTALKCKGNLTSAGERCYSACAKEPNVEMSHGGNGNLCSSCIGITPGQCALKREDIAFIRSNFTENENFSIHSTTGEYKLVKNIDAGLSQVYSQLITKPKNPGCYKGSSPAYNTIFSPVEDSGPSRSVNSDEKPL